MQKLPEYGHMILFSSKKKTFFQSAKKLFSRSKYTHVATLFPPVLGEKSYFGAEEAVDMRPISDIKDDNIEIYVPVGFTQEQIDRVLHKLYMTYAGSIYGFFKLFWFIYRWFMEVVFHDDVRAQHNWFPAKQICSEVSGWWWLEYLCDEQPGKCAILRMRIHEWNSHTFHPGDCGVVVKEFPELFKKIELKDLK